MNLWDKVLSIIYSKNNNNNDNIGTKHIYTIVIIYVDVVTRS